MQPDGSLQCSEGWIQSAISHPIYLGTILILSSHNPTGSFLSSFSHFPLLDDFKEPAQVQGSVYRILKIFI